MSFENREYLGCRIILSYSKTGSLLISGIALSEGVWKSIFYPREELQKWAKSLMGKPLMVEHGLDSRFNDRTVGIVESSEYIEPLRSIIFSAKITDSEAKKLIEDGTFPDVSCCTYLDRLPEDGKVVGRNYRFDELSLTKAGACETATIISKEQLSKVVNNEMAIEKLILDETETSFRYRIRNPDEFQEDSFRTITISEEEGISAVIGRPKGKDTTEVQSYIFSKDAGWTESKVKEWIEEHKEKESMYRETLSEDERKELNELRKLKEIVEKTPETKVLSELILQKNKKMEEDRIRIESLERTKTELEVETAKVPLLEHQVADLTKAVDTSIELAKTKEEEHKTAMKTAVGKAKVEVVKDVESGLPPRKILIDQLNKNLPVQRLVKDIKKKLDKHKECDT